MGQHITAVSFEADGVQVITVQTTRSSLVVKRTLTLQADQLDAFLASDAASTYLVAINPTETIFETLQIPPADKKLEATLVYSEAARLHPELGHFSCAYQVLGDIPGDGRIIRKVACCLISHQALLPALEPFIRNNKTVRQMVAAPHALAALVAEQLGTAHDPLLCAHDDGHSKTLFLLENGAVSFSRSIASNGYGWDPLDRQNVSMTLDYCFQALRTRANRVLLLNSDQQDDADQPFPRLEPIGAPAQLADIAPETRQTMLVPLALALYRFPDQQNLLPEDYCRERFKQLLFGTGSKLLAVIAAIMLLLIVFGLTSIRSTRDAIKILRAQEIHLAETVQAHQLALAEKNSLQPLLTIWNEHVAGADIPHTFATINSIATSTVNLSSLKLKREKETVTLTLGGTISGPGFASMQEGFEAYMTALRTIHGMQITRNQLDPKGQTFTLEAVYTP